MQSSKRQSGNSSQKDKGSMISLNLEQSDSQKQNECQGAEDSQEWEVFKFFFKLVQPKFCKTRFLQVCFTTM